MDTELLLKLFRLVVDVVARERGIHNYKVPRARHLPVIVLGKHSPYPGTNGIFVRDPRPGKVFVYEESPNPARTLLHELAHAAEIYLTGKVSGYNVPGAPTRKCVYEYDHLHGEQLAMRVADVLADDINAALMAHILVRQLRGEVMRKRK